MGTSWSRGWEGLGEEYAWTVGRISLGGGKRSKTAKQGGEVVKGPRGIRAELRRKTRQGAGTTKAVRGEAKGGGDGAGAVLLLLLT